MSNLFIICWDIRVPSVYTKVYCVPSNVNLPIGNQARVVGSCQAKKRVFIDKKFTVNLAVPFDLIQVFCEQILLLVWIFDVWEYA